MEEFNKTPKNESRKVIIGSKPQLSRRKIILIITILFIFLGLLTGAIYYIFKSKKQDKPTAITIKYEETITPNAYGNFLSTSLKGFYLGGNTNGVQIPAHNYYPSSKDIKDPNWTKENMQLDEKMNDLIAKGEVVYEPKGCNADQPSGENNKCSSFIVKSAGKILYDSTKE